MSDKYFMGITQSIGSKNLQVHINLLFLEIYNTIGIVTLLGLRRNLLSTERKSMRLEEKSPKELLCLKSKFFKWNIPP